VHTLCAARQRQARPTARAIVAPPTTRSPS
jgi:hypothetical protein